MSKQKDDDRFVEKLITLAHSKPQLPVFDETHLPTFKKQGSPDAQIQQ
jgi:hypothetical protein